MAPFPPELSAENQDRVAEVFADSYEEVIDNYTDPISASDLAIAGLRKMTQLDPAMSLEVDAQGVSLSFGDDELGQKRRAPAGMTFSTGW